MKRYHCTTIRMAKIFKKKQNTPKNKQTCQYQNQNAYFIVRM